MNATERFFHGFTMNLNYNYSKNLDNFTGGCLGCAISDVFNRGLNKTYRQRSAAPVPVYGAVRGAADPLVEADPQEQIRVDRPVWMGYRHLPVVSECGDADRPTSSGSLPISQFLGRGPGGAQLKKNADGSYVNPWSVDWTDNSGQHHTDPLDINCHCFDPTKTVVFNPAAWENAPNGQWGADQSALRWYRGVRHPGENANFSRTFRVKERVTMNFRVEFNNIFNRMVLPTPIGGNVTAVPAARSI